MVRASGNVPLKRAKDAWAKLYNADDTKPNLNRDGQNVLFRELADMSKQLGYDLSSMFSRSTSINQAEKVLRATTRIRFMYHRSISLSRAAQTRDCQQ